MAGKLSANVPCLFHFLYNNQEEGAAGGPGAGGGGGQAFGSLTNFFERLTKKILFTLRQWHALIHK